MSIFKKLAMFLLTFGLVVPQLYADSKAQMEKDARKALEHLYTTSTGAKTLGEKAKGILVFPAITKGGLVVGGQYGEGVLFKGNNVEGYYNTAAASVGLQAGLQKYGYALFFMKDSDLEYLKKTDGWEVGVGPNLTVVDQGIAASLSTTTANEGIYAFFFEQKGLMAGLGLQGTKITKIEPKA